MSDGKMRAEFEKWAEDNDCGITLAATSATGFYTRNIAWTAWQAAYQAGRKAERAELERRERSALEKLRAELRAAKFGRTSRKQKDKSPPQPKPSGSFTGKGIFTAD